jgi:dipeptidase
MAAGETLRVGPLQLPQVRQTCAVLGSQAPGSWGFAHGFNQHQVAVGHSCWRSRLAGLSPGLTGADLTRLGLERGKSARQALDVLIDLITRHGQAGGDHVFLVVDPWEAFALEAAGSAWVVHEIAEVRAAGDVSVVRQDWDRIAPGLAEHVIGQGWWPADGSKVDFVGSLADCPVGESSALRRWGRATVLLEQQSGRIDGTFVRRLLADHYEGTGFEAKAIRGGVPVPLCRHPSPRSNVATVSSMVVEANPASDAQAVAWCALGPPCLSVYFPVFVEAELPGCFSADAPSQQRLRELLAKDRTFWPTAQECLGQLQARFDQDVVDFVPEAAALTREGKTEERNRLAGLLMQSHGERFEDTVQALVAEQRRKPLAPAPVR